MKANCIFEFQLIQKLSSRYKEGGIVRRWCLNIANIFYVCPGGQYFVIPDFMATVERHLQSCLWKTSLI